MSDFLSSSINSFIQDKKFELCRFTPTIKRLLRKSFFIAFMVRYPHSARAQRSRLRTSHTFAFFVFAKSGRTKLKLQKVSRLPPLLAFLNSTQSKYGLRALRQAQRLSHAHFAHFSLKLRSSSSPYEL